MNTFRLSATSSLLTSKTVLTPITYGKHKMWRCPILHEVQFFKTVLLRNKVQHKNVKHMQVAATARHASSLPSLGPLVES